MQSRRILHHSDAPPSVWHTHMTLSYTAALRSLFLLDNFTLKRTAAGAEVSTWPHGQCDVGGFWPYPVKMWPRRSMKQCWYFHASAVPLLKVHSMDGGISMWRSPIASWA